MPKTKFLEIMHQPLERATGTLKATIIGSGNRIGELYQKGSSRLFFPKNFSKTMECVLINTAGGITGGDKFKCSIKASEESSILVTTQASEKVYRAINGSAEVETQLSISKNSKLVWLPQDTILFSESNLSRKIIIHIEDGAEFLAFDQIVLGRSAMGENIVKSNLHDNWKIYYRNKLIYFDQSGWKNNVPLNCAGLKNIRSYASFFYVGPKVEAYEQKLKNIKQVIKNVYLGSSLRNDCLLVRMFGSDAKAIKDRAIHLLRDIWQLDIPNVWKV